MQKTTKTPVKVASAKTATATPSAPTTTTAPSGTNALFVVQVFSSPSRVDADQRLQLLRQKNVSDAYITEQQIKDQTWYRVRFGNFGTRQAAEAEAIRLGFKEPWVARIR